MPRFKMARNGEGEVASIYKLIVTKTTAQMSING